MNSGFSFRELSAADRWLFAGNVLTALGLLAISVGTALRLAADGGLPSGRPVFSNGAQPLERTTNNPKGYFDN